MKNIIYLYELERILLNKLDNEKDIIKQLAIFIKLLEEN